MAACSMVYHTFPLSDGVLMRFCRHFVGVQFGWHNGDEVLKHVVRISSDFLCAVQRADNSRKWLSEGQVVNPVREVVRVMGDEGG